MSKDLNPNPEGSLKWLDLLQKLASLGLGVLALITSSKGLFQKKRSSKRSSRKRGRYR
jgi:hypothetical protein